MRWGQLPNATRVALSCSPSATALGAGGADSRFFIPFQGVRAGVVPESTIFKVGILEVSHSPRMVGMLLIAPDLSAQLPLTFYRITKNVGGGLSALRGLGRNGHGHCPEFAGLAAKALWVLYLLGSATPPLTAASRPCPRTGRGCPWRCQLVRRWGLAGRSSARLPGHCAQTAGGSRGPVARFPVRCSAACL